MTYPGGGLRPNHITQAQQDADVRAFYDYWKASYLVAAGNAPDGTPLYRVTMGSSSPGRTTSESQGFGMTIVALMAGYDAQAQAIFNGLWKFVQLHPSGVDSRLMTWEVPADPDSSASAFDGDADIAHALLLADKQWGSSGAVNYMAAAQTLITAIRQSTIGAQSGLPLLGDWVLETSDPKYSQWAPRSSDFMLANFRAFQTATGDATWGTVISQSQSTIGSLQANYSPATGLLPDFIEPTSATNTAPKPARPDYLEDPNDGNYYYNACRVPLRVGLHALLYDDTTSRAQAQKLAGWAATRADGNAINLSHGYTLAGNELHPTWGFTSVFAAPIGVAAMTLPDTSANRAWLNSIYSAVAGSREGYYEDTVTLLSLLVMTGNHWGTDTQAADLTAPTVNITYPTYGATITGEISAVSGTAADVGSGVQRVEILFYRRVPGGGTDDWEFWNGSFWHWDDPPLATTLNTSVNPNTWTRTSGFPTAANFPPGKYYIRAQSFDHAGHASSPLYISFYKQ